MYMAIVTLYPIGRPVRATCMKFNTTQPYLIWKTFPYKTIVTMKLLLWYYAHWHHETVNLYLYVYIGMTLRNPCVLLRTLFECYCNHLHENYANPVVVSKAPVK